MIRDTLEQACQTQSNVWAAQLYSKTEKLSAGRSFETFFLFRSPFIAKYVSKLVILCNFEAQEESCGPPV
jgi:hypothetical protein